MREIKVEEHLRLGVEAMDGLCLKFVSPGRANVPDRLLLLDFVVPHEAETKAPGKDATEAQAREHERHRARNMPVYVLDTIEKVDHHLYVLRKIRDAYRANYHIYDARELEFIVQQNAP